jgi:hypothetical protein
MAERVAELSDLAEPCLGPGERMLAVVPNAAARGAVESRSGVGLSGFIFGPMERRNAEAADAAGIKLASYTGIVLTGTRLLTFDEAVSPTGHVRGVDLLSATPLADIDSIEARRRGFSGILRVTPRGGRHFEIGCTVACARNLAATFGRMHHQY